MKILRPLLIAVAVAMLTAAPCPAQGKPARGEARKIAEEAFIYAFPVVTPDASKIGYTLTFPAGMLPPVNAFWSVTMYDGKSQLLVANAINPYLINSPMLPNLTKNSDGPIYVVMRLYWPEESVLEGGWKPPSVHPAR